MRTGNAIGRKSMKFPIETLSNLAFFFMTFSGIPLFRTFFFLFHLGLRFGKDPLSILTVLPVDGAPINGGLGGPFMGCKIYRLRMCYQEGMQGRRQNKIGLDC